MGGRRLSLLTDCGGEANAADTNLSLGQAILWLRLASRGSRRGCGARQGRKADAERAGGISHVINFVIRKDKPLARRKKVKSMRQKLLVAHDHIQAAMMHASTKQDTGCDGSRRYACLFPSGLGGLCMTMNEKMSSADREQ